MKRRALWIVLALVAALLLGGVAVWMSAAARAREVINRHQREVAGEFARLRAADWERPPLFGPPVDGNSWDLLPAAVNAFDSLSAEDAKAFPRLDGREEAPDAATLDPVLEKLAPQFAALRTVLRRRTCNPDWEYESGFELLLPLVSKSIKLSKMTADAATLRHAQQRDEEALEFILLGLATAADANRRGPLVCELVQIVAEGVLFEVLAQILDGHRLSEPVLASLAEALDRYGASRVPPKETLAIEDAMSRASLVKLAQGGFDPAALGASPRFPPMMAAKYGFSTRAMTAHALNLLQEYRRRIETEVQSRPPREREAAAERVTQDLLNEGNPIIEMLLPALGRTYRNRAEAEARFALARAAVAAALHQIRTGAWPADTSALPADPLAQAPLRMKLDGDALVIWSVGLDGDDDGAKPVPEGGEDGDLVWRLDRR